MLPRTLRICTRSPYPHKILPIISHIHLRPASIHRSCTITNKHETNERNLHAADESAPQARKRIHAQVFSWTRRSHRPAFSDYAHFSFLTFLVCFLSVRGEVSIKHPISNVHYRYLFSDILIVSYPHADQRHARLRSRIDPLWTARNGGTRRSATIPEGANAPYPK